MNCIQEGTSEQTSDSTLFLPRMPLHDMYLDVT